MGNNHCDPHCASTPCVNLDTAFFPRTLGTELGKVLSEILHPFCISVSVAEVLTV